MVSLPHHVAIRLTRQVCNGASMNLTVKTLMIIEFKLKTWLCFRHITSVWSTIVIFCQALFIRSEWALPRPIREPFAASARTYSVIIIQRFSNVSWNTLACEYWYGPGAVLLYSFDITLSLPARNGVINDTYGLGSESSPIWYHFSTDPTVIALAEPNR